jgi:hypothetical protein
MREQTVLRQGTSLTNFVMQKDLTDYSSLQGG